MALDIGGSIVASIDLNIRNFVDNAEKAKSKADELQGAGKDAFSAAESRTGIFGMSLDALGGKLVSVGQKMSLFVTTPIVGFFGAAFAGASSLEQSFGKVDAVFGDLSGGIVEWSETSATAFGMSQTEALGMVGTYGQIMQAQGMATDQSAEYSQELIGLAADMSAFSDRDISESSNAIRAALTGEYESLKSFGIVLKAADVEQEALNLAIADGSGVVTEAHRVQARYNLIMDQTTQMHGQFEREASGASGQLAIFKAQAKDTAANFGQLLLPAGTRVLQMFNRLLTWVNGLSDGWKRLALGTMAVVAAIGPLLIGVGTLMKHMSTVTTVVRGLSAGFTLLTSPVGLVVVGIAALAAGLIYAYTHSETFRGIVDALWKVIKQGVSFIADVVVGLAKFVAGITGLDGVIGGAIGKLKELWDVLQKVMGSPSNKTISIYADWQADQYTIQGTTLPDGTKVWHIVEDSTGETFGQVLDSYTNYDGQTYILIQPEGGGPAFWTAADLDTGKPEKIDIPIVAEDEPFQGTLTTITTATGNEVTVVINGDGEPIGTVLDEIITDPITGTKTVTIEMGDGTTFTADVDTLKNTITPLEIEVDADTAVAEENMSSLERRVQGVWDAINNLSSAFDLLGLRITRTFETMGNVITVAQSYLDLLFAAMDAGVDGFMEWAMGPIDKFISALDTAKEAWTGFKDWISGDDSRIPETTTNPETGVSRTPRLPLNDDERAARGAEQRSPMQLMGRSIGMGGGNALADMAAKMRELGSAAAQTNPFLLNTNTALQQTASTAPILGTAMDTTGTSVKGAGQGILGAFTGLAAGAVASVGSLAVGVGGTVAGMAASVPGLLSGMSSGSIAQFMAMNTGATGQVGALAGGVASRMASLSGDVTSKASSANANAVSQFSAMNASAIGQFSGMQVRAGMQMALIASTASTQGNATASNLTGALAGAVVRTAATLGQIPGIVSSVGGRAAGNAYAAGANISSSFASGMYAYLGSITAAANAMVAAADTAVRARARIASPSKLFKMLGAFLPEGMAQGILSGVPAVARAADALMGATMPSSLSALHSPDYGYIPARAGGYGYGGGGTTVIDNSTHTTEYVALNDQQFHELLKAKDRANAMHNQLTRPDGISQYRKVAR